jgi:putative endonuclease
MGDKKMFVYILAGKRNGTLYTGVTNDLIRRTYEHRTDTDQGFTKKYQVHKLVYFEEYDDPYTAISREKELKKWRRKWKLELIEKNNPGWKDLWEEITG